LIGDSARLQMLSADGESEAEQANTNDLTVLPIFTGDLAMPGDTYILHENKKCVPASNPASLMFYLGSSDMLPATRSELCARKCGAGCVGPRCFCDGAEADAPEDSPVLCLPPIDCRAACAAHAECTGFTVHVGSNKCLLSKREVCDRDSADYKAVHEGWNDFERMPGRACQEPTDFKAKVGEMYVTERAHTGVDYVMHPSQEGSIEITAVSGKSLAYSVDNAKPVLDTSSIMPPQNTRCPTTVDPSQTHNPHTPLVLTFNEVVTRGAGDANVYIVNSATQAKLNAEGQQVTVVGGTRVFIWRGANAMVAGQAYHIEGSAGFVEDVSGNGNVAFTTAAYWSLHISAVTADTVGPSVRAATYTPAGLRVYMSEAVAYADVLVNGQRPSTTGLVATNGVFSLATGASGSIDSASLGQWATPATEFALEFEMRQILGAVGAAMGSAMGHVFARTVPSGGANVGVVVRVNPTNGDAVFYTSDQDILACSQVIPSFTAWTKIRVARHKIGTGYTLSMSVNGQAVCSKVEGSLPALSGSEATAYLSAAAVVGAGVAAEIRQIRLVTGTMMTPPPMVLYDCGADDHCSPDDLATPAGAVGDLVLNGYSGASDGEVVVPVKNSAMLHADHKYRLVISAKGIADKSTYTGNLGSNGPQIGPAEEFTYDFYPVPEVAYDPPTQGASNDRITIIPCTGICGRSTPSKDIIKCGLNADSSARTAAECATIAAWSTVRPENWMTDAESGVLAPTPAPAASFLYTTTSNSYCAAVNVDIDVASGLSHHLCHTKCVVSNCTGNDCFCSGAMHGHDMAGSNALCLDEDKCKQACDQLTGCESFDMHKTLPRCFLNTNSCSAATANGLRTDMNYNYMEKVDPARRLASILPREVEDNGYSSARILRYKGIQFNAAGKFKVCMCDNALQTAVRATNPTEPTCADAKGYNIEIGTLHVSGVSCLLTDTKLRRGDCVDSYYGGLRCYARGQAVRTNPMEVSPGTPATQGWNEFGAYQKVVR